jgi:8-oxo-dGTP pyrophosphatase MutT (NUDIX family)
MFHMKELRICTLVFLIKRSKNSISELCLAMKKRGFGAGRWNGVGGKLNEGESVEAAAARETEEEIGVRVGGLKKVAELDFYFPHNPDWDQRVHVFFCDTWEGEPAESEEMAPQWYGVDALPFDRMWPDDIFWLPEVLQGKLVRARFVFGEGDAILEKRIDLVAEL